MEQKKIVVTGVASGIGARTARMLSEFGVHVIGMDLHRPKEKIAEFIPVNLAETASIQSAVKYIGEGIDGLCNIAGVPPTKGIQLVLQVNFLAHAR